LDYSNIVKKLEKYYFSNLKFFRLGVCELFHNADSIYGHVGDVTALLKQMPKLEYLGLYGEVVLSEPLEFKELQEMDFCRWGTSFFTDGEYMTQETLDTVLCSNYPKLSILWVDLEFDDNERKYEFPKKFLLNRNMPILKSLEIAGSFKEGVKNNFFKSPIVKKLDRVFIEELKDRELVEETAYFINLFTLVFQRDWKSSKKILKADLFENKWSFIYSKWVTNWVNRDSLVDAYEVVQKNLSKKPISMDTFKKELQAFIYYFELVFDEDWEYSNMLLSGEDECDGGTFLYSKDDSPLIGWREREHLLENYEKVKSLIK